MLKRSSKTPSDPNQLASFIVNQTTQPNVPEKNPSAVALGKLGGKKGGPARAKALSAKKRSEIARKGGLAKHAKKSKK